MPTGKACKLEATLKKKHMLHGKASRLEWRQLLKGMKMKKEDVSVTMFEQASVIEKMFIVVDQCLDNDDLISTVMNAVLHENMSVIMSGQSAKGNSLTMEDLERVTVGSLTSHEAFEEERWQW